MEKKNENTIEMDYESFDPHPDLASLIKCFWTLKVPYQPDAPKQRILPDGCIEMIFILGDDIKRYTSDTDYIFQPRVMILGQIKKPFFVEPAGVVDSFAVRFYPYGFANFASLPISQLADKETPVKEVFGNVEAEFLENEIRNASGTEKRIEIVEKFFIKKSRENNVVDKLVKTTIDSVFSTEGSLSIGSVLENNPSKRRQLERLFQKQVGISPKQFAKVIRLQAALRLILDNKNRNYTEIAYEVNYFDQSHFIKDFKEFTGTNPGEFFKDIELTLSSIIYKNE